MKEKIRIFQKNNSKVDKWKSDVVGNNIEITEWFVEIKTKKRLMVDGGLVSVGTFKAIGIKDSRIKQGMYFTFKEVKYLIENVDNASHLHTKIEGIEM